MLTNFVTAYICSSLLFFVVAYNNYPVESMALFNEYLEGRSSVYTIFFLAGVIALTPIIGIYKVLTELFN